MSVEETRAKEMLGARSLGNEVDEFSPSSYVDPSTAPTISSVRLDSEATGPTRLDPNAPIHQGVLPNDSDKSRARNHVALPVGYSLNEYTIEAVLGSGGFGITYRARDNNLQCTVAIKEYLPTDLAVRTAGQTVCAKTESDTHGYRIGLDGFLAEARVLASFRHPHIVRVTRFFEANNTAYMVMDYEKGQALGEWIKRNGPVREPRLLKLFLPLLDGLDVVHRARVLHRDIKPANIYVREDEGGLVLLDFGAARYTRSDDSRSLTSIVTPGYAPFEQYHTHGAQGPWSDLYALGGVLYWIVTGHKPHEAPSRIKKDAMPTALSAGKGRYGERLLRAIDWALRPDEVDRPKSVSQFRAVLTGEAEIPPPLPDAPAVQPATAKPRSRGPMLALGVAAAVALAGALVALYPKAQKSEPPAATALAPAAPVVGASNAATGQSGAKTGAASLPAETRGGKPSNPAAPGQPAASAGAASDAPKVKAPGLALPRTATVVLNVTPRGEVILDGKPVGISPPLTRLAVSADVKHKLEIHSLGAAPPHYWTIELKSDETREIRANFEKF